MNTDGTPKVGHNEQPGPPVDAVEPLRQYVLAFAPKCDNPWECMCPEARAMRYMRALVES